MASKAMISTQRISLLVALALSLVLQRASGQGSSLLFVSTPASWSGAEADCVKRGGHLASISTAADNQQVQALCAKNLPNAQLRPKVSSTTPGCWIGLNDQAIEGKYVWSDGTAYSYVGWYQGADMPQPDDDKQTQYDEDCTLFIVASGFVGWHDWGCADTQAYVCEIPVARSPSLVPSPSPSPVISPGESPKPSPASQPIATTPTTVLDSATGSGNSDSLVNLPAGGITQDSGSSSGAQTAGTTGSSTVGQQTPVSTSSSGSTGSATSVTGSVASGGTANNTGTPDSLANGANSGISGSNAAAGPAPSTDGNEKWKLVVSIVVPVLTGLAALITIAYTGWKWWHKRQATLARQRAGMGFGPHPAAGRNVKPLIAVDV